MFKKILSISITMYKKHPFLIRFGVVAVIFGILFSNIHPSEIFHAFGQANPLLLLLAIALTIPNILIQMLKWHFILGIVEPRPSFKYAVLSVIGGFFLGALSPGRTGELARGILIPGCSKLKTASLTIVDKGFNQVITLMTGFFALMLLLPWPMSLFPVIGEMVLIAALFNIHRLKPRLERFLHRYIHSSRVDNALAAFDALSTGRVLGMMLYSALFYFIYVAQYYVIILSFTDLPFQVALKTLPVIYFINLLLPISVGDFGVKEMVSMQLLQPFGIAGEFAVSASLTNNVLTFLIPSIIGGIIVAFFVPKPAQADLPSDDHTTPSSG